MTDNSIFNLQRIVAESKSDSYEIAFQAEERSKFQFLSKSNVLNTKITGVFEGRSLPTCLKKNFSNINKLYTIVKQPT